MSRLAVRLLLGLLSAALLAPEAGAAGTVRIAVVHAPQADTSAVRRLHDELSAVGLEVVDLPERAKAPEGLEGAARKAGAEAVVRVVPNRGGVEVWVLNRRTGGTLFQGNVIGPGGVFDDVLAVQTAEVVRATLVDLGLAPAPAPPATPAPEPARPAPPRAGPPPHDATPTAAKRFVLALGPGLSATPRGPGPVLHAFVGFRYRPASSLGVGAWGAASLTTGTVEASAGSSSVRPLLVGADVVFWPLPASSTFELSAAAGLALAYLAIEGRPAPASRGRADALTLALPFTRLSLAWWFQTHIGIGADALVGVAVPRPSIRFNGEEVATWGRPLVLGVLSCVARFD